MKTVMFICGVALISLGAASVRDLPQHPASFGAPVSSTGAPAERTCAESGCHDTYSVNAGRGTMSITVAGAEKGFEAGKTYDVTVRVADNNSRRFGFQLTALDGNGAMAGGFTVADPERTQILMNELKLKDRQYATYTYPGTEQYAAGEGRWTLRWTAPAGAKNVTFYAATVVADDDNTDDGDYVLTDNLQLQPATPSGANVCEAPALTELPFIDKDNFLYCTVNVSQAGEVSAELCDISGQVFNLGKRYFPVGLNRQAFLVPSVSAGAYILRLRSRTGSASHTILVGKE